MERLPYIDEHAANVSASPERTWPALIDTLRATFGGGDLGARLLGCDPARESPHFAGLEGETLPGFRVVEAEPGRRLVLHGRHHFSEYRLTFALEDGALRARTHAAFPGVRGRLYRAAVIGTRAHVLVTRWMLRQVARRAAARPELAEARPADELR